MNKEELLEEVRKAELAVNLAEQYNGIDTSLADDVWHLIDCINQLDEPQKPIIPQFVADYIETYKERGLSLVAWFEFLNYEDEFENKTEEWLYGDSQEEMLKREYLLIDAIRHGYEVEEEKRYRVVFRSHKDDLILFKTGEHIFIGAESANGGNWKQHFTESEIKDYDERFWAFAEEVTD